MGNVKPVTADGQALPGAAGASIGEMHITSGSTQSNGYDCGCHTIMALRAMAAVAVQGGSWFDVGAHLPEGKDEERDDAWRLQFAAECFAGQITLT